MTVIATQITDQRTVHATDSLLTKDGGNGSVEATDRGQPKIILVPHFKGAISWWGKVKCKVTEGDDESGEIIRDWDASQWLLEKAKLAKEYDSSQSERFSEDLAGEMNYRLKDILADRGEGIGLHFSAYEEIDGNWIPELFLITNYTGFTLGGGYPTGKTFLALRQTYHTLSKNKDVEFAQHGGETYRRRVMDHLRHEPGALYTYNNGHVVQFSHHSGLLDAIMAQVKTSDYDYLEHRPLFFVRTMVEAQERFRPMNKRAIGGPCFDVVIDPLSSDVYTSHTNNISDFPCGS